MRPAWTLPTEVGCVLSREVERDGEEEGSGPPVDGIERERLPVADQVGDEPDDEPDQCHRCASLGSDAVSLSLNERSASQLGVAALRLVCDNRLGGR